MWPTLISLGPIAIHSFGVMVFLGVFLGGFIWWQRGKEEGMEEDSLIDIWLTAGVISLITARIGQILSHWQDFGASWYKMVFFTKFPGLSYEGAWLGAILTLIILVLKKGWNMWQALDLGVLALVMVEIFSWLGALLAGSNLGKATGWWWGLKFPGVETSRQPVQILWFIGLWLLYRLLAKWEKTYRSFNWYQQENGEAKPGLLLSVYLIVLGLLKLSLGFLTDIKELSYGLGLNQWFGVILMIGGGLILLFRSGKLNELKLKTATVKLKPRLKRKKRGFDFK